MGRLALVGAQIALCVTLLSACSSDPTEADPTTTTPSTSISPTPTPTTTPTAPAGPAAPVLPTLAKQESLGGARSFVRYFMAVINYSSHQRTGDLPRKLSTVSCISCRGIADSNDKLREGGGFYHGGDWIVTSTSPIPLQTLTRPIIHTAITVTAGTWKRSPDDHLRMIKAERMYLDVHLIWVENHWLVTRMALT